jgi:hypothetical protein
MVLSRDVETSIKVIQFSGKQKDWAVWEEKFMARAKRKGFKDLLLGKATIPKTSDVLDEKSDDDKKKKIRQKMKS